MNITRFKSIFVLLCTLFMVQHAKAQCDFTPSAAVINVSCFGGSNGSIDLTVVGGVQPIQFEWSNGFQNEDLVNLAAGTYKVTVTNGIGCTETFTSTITQPDLLTVGVSGDNINCWYEYIAGLPIYETEILASAQGGTSSYFYIWSNNSQGAQTTVGAAGTYTVTVIDGNSCTASAEQIILMDTIHPTADAGPVVNFNCQTAEITLGGNGSTSGPGTSYDWSGPGITTGPGGNSTDQFPTVDVPGAYTLVVYSSNFCAGQDVVTVGGFLPPVANAGPDTGIPCGGGQVTLDGSASSIGAPYAYVWTTTSGNIVAGVNTLNPVVDEPGTYKLSVFDTQNSCIQEDVVIVFPGPIIPVQNHFVLDVSCTGQLGEAAVTMTQGTGPYTYLWSNGSTNSNTVNVFAGTYTVTVTDATGCAYFGVLVVEEDHSNVSLTTLTTPKDCAGGVGGTVDLTVTGMFPPISYAWGLGETTQDLTGLVQGTYYVTVSFAFGTCSITTSAYVDQINTTIQLSTQVTNDDCTSNCTGLIDLTVAGGTAPYQYFWGMGNTTQDVSNLCSGNYNLTVSDASGCRETTLTFVGNQSSNMVATAVSTDASCIANNGTIDLTVTGGAPPYNYNWTDGGTTQDRVGLSINTYTVTVMDAMGCTNTASATVGQTSGFALSAAVTASTACAFSNGAIDLSVAPGGNYTYVWSNTSTTEDQTNIPSGTYTVTVSDGSACTEEETYIVPDNPNFPIATAALTPSTCDLSNGSIDVTIALGVAPYFYQWTIGATTQDISNIPSGNYELTVTGANGCTNTLSVDVANNNLTFNIVEVIFANTSCIVPNGNISINVFPPGSYIYTWSNGATSQSLTGLISGTYGVTVSAGGSCTQTEIYTVPDLANSPDITSTVTDASCNTNDGAINLTVTGGTPVYTYNWNDGNTTEDITGLASGTYTVTVTDSGGCSKTADVTVGQLSGLSNSATVVQVSCFGGNNGSINLTVTGGVTPYTYAWTGGSTTEDRSGVVAGTYTVTVTDANACSKTLSVTITQPTALSLSSTNFNVACNGGSNGSINLTVTGGTPSYNYLWSNGATNQDISNLSAGTYTVTVTDFAGCTKTSSRTVTHPPDLALSWAVNNVSCFGGNDGAVNLTTSGGTAGYTYNWSNGATAQDLINLIAGIYTVTVTDVNNCTETITTIVNQPTQIVFSIISLSNTCSSESITGPNLPNFTYLWSGPNGFTSTTAAITANFSGIYSLTVTNVNGCTASNSYTVNLSGTGACGAIKGQVFHDEDESCSLNAGEPGLAGWIVRAEGVNDTLYGVTNAQGKYLVGVPIGTYAMKVLVPNGLWTICPGGALATVGMVGDTVSGGDFPVMSTYICPALTVSIGTDKLRRCSSDNSYEVEYCNQGTQKAEDAYITVVLDQYLTAISASAPYTDQGSNVLHFEVGDLEIGECGTFSIKVSVNCNAVLGQTHCTQASIYPDTLCAPSNTNWSGASLSVQSACSNDSLRFIIRNDGKATMTTTRDYIVVEDGIMFRSGVLMPLIENDSMVIAVPANGSTWRVEVGQESFHPYPAPIGLSVEGCATASFSTGFVNQFSTPDEPPAVDFDCTTNIGSFDPNDKYGYPVGYGADHYVRPGTDIEYLVRFQNTGTDTAFTVHIIDTLSSWLDPATIRFGASSHPYRYDLNGEGIVHFVFENILLPDSNTNEVASHGFAKFIIKPRFDAPLETVIENTAAIYFDFNDPVFTNTTFHRLGVNFITVGIWQPFVPDAQVIAVPNPFNEETTLEVKGLRGNNALRLQVFDLQGSMVREMESENAFFQLKKGDWQSGIYLFKITQNGRLVGNGKLMAE